MGRARGDRWRSEGSNELRGSHAGDARVESVCREEQRRRSVEAASRLANGSVERNLARKPDAVSPLPQAGKTAGFWGLRSAGQQKRLCAKATQTGFVLGQARVMPMEPTCLPTIWGLDRNPGTLTGLVAGLTKLRCCWQR